jgi:hypothetical protein
VSARQIHEDIGLVRERWREASRRNIHELREQTVARLMRNSQLYLQKEAYTAHIANERLLAEIQGLRRPDIGGNTTVNVATTAPVQVNVQQDPEADRAIARALLEAADRAEASISPDPLPQALVIPDGE